MLSVSLVLIGVGVLVWGVGSAVEKANRVKNARHIYIHHVKK